MLSSNQETFLQLVRLGIGHSKGGLPVVACWDQIETIASQQGLSA